VRRGSGHDSSLAMGKGRKRESDQGERKDGGVTQSGRPSRIWTSSCAPRLLSTVTNQSIIASNCACDSSACIFFILNYKHLFPQLAT
jgi:hypothetical protein